MLLERYYDETLAQASYLVGCERSREAVIVDPNRDVTRYLDAARRHGMRIAWVAETHIHADFLSGSLALAQASGARLLLSDEGGADWRYAFAESAGARLVRDGDSLEIGRIRFDVVHTPGHTPEHIVFVVTDGATGDRPIGMLSGDFLFVGDVGRPDLLEKAAGHKGTMERAARQLFASLSRLGKFPDFLQVWPGHGAGSACGKSLGAVPQTTLGYERLYNPALQHRDEASFVKWVLADQPEAPPYFAVMKRLNRDGPPAPPAGEPRELGDPDIVAAMERGDWLVDLRPTAEFAKSHTLGAVNVPLSQKFPTYAGTVLDHERAIVLLAKDARSAASAAAMLSLIGMDRITGWSTPGAVQKAGSIGSIPSVDPKALAEQLKTNGPRVVDVRGRSEWREGHIAKADHIYLGDLAAKLDSRPRDERIVLHCASGSRSAIGASVLESRGFTNVANLAGGIDAWKRAGLPVESADD